MGVLPNTPTYLKNIYLCKKNMALMRTRRKGDPPVKKKNVQEVTVSANKPAAKSTWEDVERNEMNSKANKASEETYAKQLKFYNEQQKGGVKDLKTMFAGGGRYLNADELKRWNAENSNNVPERAGLESEKIYVPKAFKYGDPTNNKGGIKTAGGKGYEGAGPVHHEYLKKPTKPGPLPIKEINPKDLSLPKMDYLKPGPLPTKGGKLKEAPEKTKPEDWSIKKPSRFSGTSISYSAPSLNRRKAVKGEDNVKFGSGVKTDSGRFGVKKLAYAAVANPLQRVRFNKEVRQGKAYFGSNEGSSSADLATKRSSLKSDKAEFKTAIKDVRKGKAEPTKSLTKSERIKGYRAEIGTINKDLRTTNKASRYLKDLGQPSANTKITEYKTSDGEVKTINTGKIQYATPGRFEGFADSPQNKRVDKLANLRINPANRNTIELQLKKAQKTNNKLKNR
jgi:hypothetical protein